MSEPLAMIDGVALLAGLAIGLLVSTLYFMGLAWGMRRALASTRPALLLLASFLLRAALLIGTGLLLARWLQPLSLWVGYFAAFFLVRGLAVRRARGPAPGPPAEGR